jgi:two-component system response regulator AtoC
MGKAILVIEDEEKQRRVVGLHLAGGGYEVKGAGTAEEGWKLAGDVDLILTDLKLPGMDGLELLEKLKAQNSRTPVVVMSAFSTVENAVEAMKRGAVDFLPKPFSLDHLSVVVEKALEVSRLRDENRELREALGQRYQFENIIGSSPAMQEIFATIMRVAPTRATVLLAGESGVGKDMIARAIHQHSPRKDRPFVKINCTAIPENLMESELFGYEKGAFTGANISKPGKFEQANTGTVMLDEIGDVPASVQVKLLRILQEREFERLGSNKTQQTDVRVIAATNVDLRAALEQGTFREDLYYRLNGFTLSIPSLRERKEEIPVLSEYFMRKGAKRYGREPLPFSSNLLNVLSEHSWPGNLRELENVVNRYLVLGDERSIVEELSPSTAYQGAAAMPQEVPSGAGLKAMVRNLKGDAESTAIAQVLEGVGWNRKAAANDLQISYKALLYKIKQYDLSPRNHAS